MVAIKIGNRKRFMANEGLISVPENEIENNKLRTVIKTILRAHIHSLLLIIKY
jgi:hypothetical protein